MRLPSPPQPFLASMLALLAMLLLLVAPRVSQHLMWPASPGEPAGHTMAAMSAMPEMPAMADMASGEPHCAHRMLHHQSTPAADPMAACGYCELLLHVPLIIWHFLPLCWLLLWMRSTRPPRLRVMPASKPLPSRHSSRGPPGAPGYPVWLFTAWRRGMLPRARPTLAF
ncbi:DUF2946 domain-containing protein [Shimwellia pseudoproteus]|uniref:DUF2946 family protein n=1 Tax=Shimwellia pseudoproteus TaxID=570012 RepID=UPI0018EA4D90|nr:DUF2946 family protein [Shimwellia pseudoproteus]MBJ3814994.1 DUF2946 domain-containing protein [Shimwellia pseudoproteus]